MLIYFRDRQQQNKTSILVCIIEHSWGIGIVHCSHHCILLIDNGLQEKYYIHNKVASALGLGGGFRWVFRFPPPVTTGYSRPSRNMAEKVTQNEIPNSKLLEKQRKCMFGKATSSINYTV